MKLEQLLLTKEELPLYDTCFIIPIHQKLLDPAISLDPQIAHQVFPAAAEEWHRDLAEYAKNLEDGEIKSWIKDVFLKGKPKVKREYGRQVLNIVGWQDDVGTDPNGFARCLSISRNGGGTLYFNRSELGCETCILLKNNGGEYINFSEDKIREFSREIADFGKGIKGGVISRYSQHNVDHYPGALFLRNWAVAYMNETFKRHKELFVK